MRRQVSTQRANEDMSSRQQGVLLLERKRFIMGLLVDRRDIQQSLFLIKLADCNC